MGLGHETEHTFDEETPEEKYSDIEFRGDRYVRVETYLKLRAENARLREENKAFESDVETIAAHNIELQEQLAAAQAMIEQMRKALQGLVKNDGVDAFYHLDKGIGTATVSGKCWLRAREAATLQPCPEVLNKVRVEAVAKFAKHVDDYEVDKLAAVYIKHIEKGEA